MENLEALEYIHSTIKFGVKLGLDNVKYLLALLGNPHKNIKFVHIAGTNGKGSTASFINNVLIESGYKVGLFTSPYIERFTERIKINNKEIEEHELARLTTIVKGKVDEMWLEGKGHPTEFEIVTAIAFLYYYEKECDIVVLEVGLGGRFDATNIIEKPILSIITSISYDHMDQLGDTLDKIAYEKAGIIKENCDVILYPQDSNVSEGVIFDIANKNNSRVHSIAIDKLHIKYSGLNGQVFSFENFEDLHIALIGEHQVKNALVALKALEILREKGFNTITEATIRHGLNSTIWCGRLEVISREPIFIVDGAHNLDGAKKLKEALHRYFPQKKITFIVGVLKDKDCENIIKGVLSIAGQFIAITPPNHRAMEAGQLADLIRNYHNDVYERSSISEGINLAIQLTSEDGVICSFGSLYYIDEVKKFFAGYSKCGAI